MGTPRREWTDIDREIVARYPIEGFAGLAGLGLSKGTIGARAWRLGVNYIGPCRSQLTRSARSTSVDQAYFDTWSPNMAWLLGFTWADGAVFADGRHYAVHWRVAIKDEHVIHDIRRELRLANKIKRFGPARIGKYVCQPQIGVSATCMRLVNCLIGRGVLPNKSNIDPLMPTVPPEYFGHFLRGVLDGDGSIILKNINGTTRSRVIFYGTIRFITQLADTIPAMANIRQQRVLCVGSSEKLRSVNWQAAAEVRRLLAFMYPDGQYLALRRKRAVAKEIMETLPFGLEQI